MSLPLAQNVVVVEASGGPDVLEYRVDHPMPTIQEGEVLVKNTFSGINFVDTYFRSGFYPSVKPQILGREGAGMVVSLGHKADEYDLKVGDRVVWLGGSGYAQYTAVPAAKTIKLPDNVSEEDATATFMGGLTALALVEETYHVQAGDWVLLHAGAGAVGVLMTQILKNKGAKVIATAGGSEKVALVKGLGADHVIDYRSEDGRDWAETVKKLTGGSGVDVVFDSVAKDTWEGSLEAVKRKGTVVWYGNASGPVPPLTLHRLAPKCIKIARPTLFGYIDTREEFEHYCKQLFSLLATGKLRVSIYRLYSLAEVQHAHEDLESRRTMGKLLLKL